MPENLLPVLSILDEAQFGMPIAVRGRERHMQRRAGQSPRLGAAHLGRFLLDVVLWLDRRHSGLGNAVHDFVSEAM